MSRAVMRHGTSAVCVLLIILTCVSCATLRGAPGALPDIEPGQRPSLDTDEAGLWMLMDRVETSLRTSGGLVTDPGLTTYVRGVVCQLAGSYCPDIRVYVIQTPHFNATMAPNGAIAVWTGLILRTQNEAQLAYILGHELGHYLRRHSVQMWRDVRSTSDLLVLFNVLAAAAGVGYAGNLGQLIALGSLYAFSRDNEREADDVGFELMVKAGYDPHEAPKIWEALIKERDAAKDPAPFIFFATHPPTEERIATLRKLAQEAAAQGGPAVVGKDRFVAATRPLRATFLRDELRQREFARSQIVLDHLIDTGVGLGELYFFQGELHRLRAEPGDEAKAITAYQRALEAGDAPIETHRALGLLYAKAGDKQKARLALQRYLRGRPDAEDRAMIQRYLQQLD